MDATDKQLRKDLLNAGWTVKIRTRKLAAGPTKYFKVAPVRWASNLKHDSARDAIAKYYPYCHLTSGSYVSLEFTFVEKWTDKGVTYLG